MEWFRHYHGMSSDPKLTAVALTADVHHCVAVAAWCFVLEHASSNVTRGNVTGLSPKVMAIGLRINMAEADRLMQAFEEEGLILPDRSIAAWEKRQKASDSSAERVRKWREKRAAETAVTNGGTEQSVDVTLPTRSRNVKSEAEKNREDSDSSLRSESERARKPAPATRIPDDWTLTPELIAFGREKGFDDGRIRDMAEAFVDHWRSSDKPTARKRDWVAAFRQWVRHELERPTPQPAYPGALNGAARGHGALGQAGRPAIASAVVHARKLRAHGDQR